MTKYTIYEKFLIPEQPFQVYLVISFHLNFSKVDKTNHHSAFVIFTISHYLHFPSKVDTVSLFL